MVKTLVDNNHETLKILKKEFVDNDETLSSVNEIGEEYGTVEDLKMHYPVKNKKLEEALDNYISENDLKFSKTEFPDKWKCLTEKLAYPLE